MSVRLTVRLRLTLWYTALLAGALLLFSSSVYVLLSRSLVSNLDTSLHQRINQVIPSVDVSNGRPQLPQSTEDIDAPYIPAVVISSSGGPLGGVMPAPLAPWLRQHGAQLRSGFDATTVGDLRIATAPIEAQNRRVGYVLVWQSLHSIDLARRDLLLLMLAAGPALLLIAGIGGMLLARRALSPVTQITRVAADISATDLHQRVPVGATRDELNALASTFNAMIERLEAAVERERRFTADASHELRSPLAVILAEASLALEERLSPEEYRAALHTIQEHASGMTEMIAALLTLARIETVHGRPEVVPLVDVMSRAIRQCTLVARERGVRISGYIDTDLRVEGNPTLLVRAVRNILDNAVKASQWGDVVRYVAHQGGAMLTLTIQDTGPGIAADDLERIFEPFYQVERARTPGDSHGLGLAICRRIISAHGGQVTVSSQPGHGACFGILLPSAPHTVPHAESLETTHALP